MIPLHDDNPTGRLPRVTIVLIVLNAAVFLVEVGQGSNMERFIWKYGYVPAELVKSRDDLRREMIDEAPARPVMDRYGRVRVDRFGNVIAQPAPLPFSEVVAVPAWINIFTCMFMHGGWMHIIGNMWYLWIFGNNIEDRLGPALYLVLYLATGLAGNLAHTAFDASVVPLVGASGAISGVMGAYVLTFPHARVLAAVPLGWYWMTVKLPAWIFLGIYFVFQNIFPAVGGRLSGHEKSNVAFLAHIGGFIVGAILILALPKRPILAVDRPARAYDDDDDADIVI